MTNQDIFRELGGLDPELVLKAAPDAQQVIPLPKRKKTWIAWAAVLALFLMLCFPEQVYAAVRGLFSLIPGIGIQQADDQTVYTFHPDNPQVENTTGRAQILRATYTEKALQLTVLVDGRDLVREDLTFTVNEQPARLGVPTFYRSEELKNSLVEFSVPMTPPKADDRFALQITGFEEALRFTMKPCESFEQLQEIGPTVTRNGISVTVTASRMGNELVVWCYEFRDSTATQDSLVGFGSPVNSGNPVRAYVETESGRIQEEAVGWSLINRKVFPLQETDKTATLHIPYLAMVRQEQSSLQLPLPEGYEKTAADAFAQTSLGKIRVVSVERVPHSDTEDKLLVQLAYENREENRQLYSFYCEVSAGSPGLRSGDSGTIEFIEITLDRDVREVEIAFDGLYYYLTDAYEMELELS